MITFNFYGKMSEHSQTQNPTQAQWLYSLHYDRNTYFVQFCAEVKICAYEISEAFLIP